jgi:hypothetical protein
VEITDEQAVVAATGMTGLLKGFQLSSKIKPVRRRRGFIVNIGAVHRGRP